jgi:peroxiredoxin family protein
LKTKDFDWKVDPDHRQHRGPGPVIHKTIADLSEEDLKRYNITPPVEKRPVLLEKMRKTPPKNRKMTIEQLLQECRRYGTNKRACTIIAEKYGYCSWTAVRGKVLSQGIEMMLKEE